MPFDATSLRRDLSAWILPLLPKGLRERLAPEFAWGTRDLKVLARPDHGDVRLLIGPMNSAGQAYEWSNAARLLPKVSATSMEFVSDDYGFGHRVDVAVHGQMGRSSHRWADQQKRVISRDVTHLLYESAAPMVPGAFRGDLTREIEEFQSRGIKVGLVFHGSDIRLPSKHRRLEPHSSFGGDLGALTELLEEKVSRHEQLVNRLALPEFVSTPDLLAYRPNADWLPTVVPGEPWTAIPPKENSGGRLTVLHAPSQSRLKGSDSIDRVMERLNREGLVDYRRVEGVAFSAMQHEVSRADVVIDQIGMGLYGVAATEAMLAGRIVVAEVSNRVREHLLESTGFELPIVQANVETLERVVRSLAAEPERYHHLGQEGRQYALRVHSPSAAAEALKPFLFGA